MSIIVDSDTVRTYTTENGNFCCEGDVSFDGDIVSVFLLYERFLGDILEVSIFSVFKIIYTACEEENVVCVFKKYVHASLKEDLKSTYLSTKMMSTGGLLQSIRDTGANLNNNGVPMWPDSNPDREKFLPFVIEGGKK